MYYPQYFDKNLPSNRTQLCLHGFIFRKFVKPGFPWVAIYIETDHDPLRAP